MKVCIHIEPQAGYSYEDIVVLAKAAEDAGFYRFSISDHFFGYPKGTEIPCYEAWTTIALLIPQTERIILGTQVTSQSYRNPALLAKIVANLDNASNGRVDLGIGAGHKAAEYEAYGYAFPSSRKRIIQLREASFGLRSVLASMVNFTESKTLCFCQNRYKSRESQFGLALWPWLHP
jgi:alkanesulfonate monooxygenase SsuD/methylene tetrahydromethanopterin reductase-like flavin-dependent oxidoreductase (luciferase family)